MLKNQHCHKAQLKQQLERPEPAKGVLIAHCLKTSPDSNANFALESLYNQYMGEMQRQSAFLPVSLITQLTPLLQITVHLCPSPL